MNPSNPQQEGAISIAQLRANPKLHSEADEQTQIRMEKCIVEERLQTYFSGPRYRTVLDDEPPTIGYQGISPVGHITTVDTLPAANVALYRVEITDVPAAVGSGRAPGTIRSLFLYVHAGDPYTANTLVQYLKLLMKKMDEDGHFLKPGAAWAMLSWGLKLMFFEYGGGTLKSVRLGDIPRKATGSTSPVNADVD
ncbi:hypothetical protein HO133_007805 [Letharia lupina]|uniref:Uncharacterized protein n=1 Tax=Letharia lupina TaxID=560253 RepID=A0A8H6CR72_9LECA|nr:uncharacterized protein HO133_007805 [Letharia lupina]KAF6228077.1 hypothetical protein HO133_007805 [Letharia lupina]